MRFRSVLPCLLGMVGTSVSGPVLAGDTESDPPPPVAAVVVPAPVPAETPASTDIVPAAAVPPAPVPPAPVPPAPAPDAIDSLFDEPEDEPTGTPAWEPPAAPGEELEELADPPSEDVPPQEAIVRPSDSPEDVDVDDEEEETDEDDLGDTDLFRFDLPYTPRTSAEARTVYINLRLELHDVTDPVSAGFPLPDFDPGITPHRTAWEASRGGKTLTATDFATAVHDDALVADLKRERNRSRALSIGLASAGVLCLGTAWIPLSSQEERPAPGLVRQYTEFAQRDRTIVQANLSRVHAAAVLGLTGYALVISAPLVSLDLKSRRRFPALYHDWDDAQALGDRYNASLEYALSNIVIQVPSVPAGTESAPTDGTPATALEAAITPPAATPPTATPPVTTPPAATPPVATPSASPEDALPLDIPDTELVPTHEGHISRTLAIAGGASLLVAATTGALSAHYFHGAETDPYANRREWFKDAYTVSLATTIVTGVAAGGLGVAAVWVGRW